MHKCFNKQLWQLCFKVVRLHNVFHLQLTSNEQTFKYTFPEEFLNKEYEIGLIKIDGVLEIEDKIINF